MVEQAGFTDDEPAEERAFDYDRTVALSDGVFAIALTLLVLNISVPGLTPGHYGVLGDRLLARRGEFESYILSFVVIALLWVRHHAFFRVLARIDTRVTLLNLTTSDPSRSLTQLAFWAYTATSRPRSSSTHRQSRSWRRSPA